jgi:hypothetical protein
VPKLDEKSGHSASLRERLQQHRSDKACAGCHDKIDPLGFALEAFDPIGRFRERDESGAPIDDSARDKEGRLIAGAAGLRAYLREHEPEFNALFARKLVGYALGRPVLATDKVLLDAMKQNLQGGDASFAGAVLGVVESKQFRNRRSD